VDRDRQRFQLHALLREELRNLARSLPLAWLNVLLPGVSVLERFVSRLRGRVEERLWHLLISRLTPQSNARLEALLRAVPGERKSQLERLRTGPTRRSAPELVRALGRVDDIRNLAIDVSVSARLPRSRVLELARFAATAKVTAIERMGKERRAATLVALVSTLEATAQDDALDVLDIVLTDIFSEASKAGIKARLRTLKDLDAAAVQAGNVSKVVLDPNVADIEIRQTVFKLMSRLDLETSVQQIDALVRPPEDVYYKELRTSYRRVCRFLPTLLKTVVFRASPAGEPLIEAIDYLKTLDGDKKKATAKPPLDIVDATWRGYVVCDGKVDLQAYTFCFLDRLRKGLRRRDVFVTTSVRYADPRLGLLEGEAWEGTRPFICRSLGLPASANEAFSVLRHELDQTYKAVATNFPNNSAARIEQVDGKDDLILTGLDKLDEPDSLIALRKEVQRRLPRAELPEILLEIAARTGFSNEFTHISERDSRASELVTSICAVLVAQACNTGTGPLERNDVPALRRSRLSWVNQNYIRNETLTAANACLVSAQNRIPLVHHWGGGEVASADGLRFVVPVRTVHAGPNPKYFGMGDGVTYYNLVSNQFTGLNGIVVPGTLRDSLVLLAVVLEQQTELNPTEIMTDTGAYADVVFGLFWLLGYRFSPRIADMGNSRLWRIDPKADYSPLNGVSRHSINADLILQHWDDLLRLAGSLKQGLVQATSIMRTLQVGDRPTKLAQAVAEVGRIDKTIHILTSIDDEFKRRRTLTQLNRGEDRHSLARAVFTANEVSYGSVIERDKRTSSVHWDL